MGLFCSQSTYTYKSADALVIPCWKSKEKAVPVIDLQQVDMSVILNKMNARQFSGEVGQVKVCCSSEYQGLLFLVGLGSEGEITAAKLHKSFAALTHQLRQENCETVNLCLPLMNSIKGLAARDFVGGVVRGILSLNYNYPVYGRKISKTPKLLRKVTLLGLAPKVGDLIFKKEEAIFSAIYCSRDHINGNADSVTPEALANSAKKMAKQSTKLHVKVLNRQQILKENMGLLAAVAKGASVEPRFIVMEFKNAPKSKDHTVLIGKGITYDTGGLDLKPGKAMLTMKEDMSGAATVMGIMQAVVDLDLSINLSVVVPATENAIDSSSYKMGDVYVGLGGLSVEIGSTDAEGRLVLADAISYAIKYLNPTRIIDFATLTGAILVSLGEDVCGLFSNNDQLVDDLLSASQFIGESMWRLPLVASYEKAISSDVADIRNIGSNRAGSITAALFLQRFVSDAGIPWAHLDIAGVAYHEKQGDMYPKYATGFGVRSIVKYLEDLTM